MASSLLLLLAKVAPSFMKKSNEKGGETKMDRWNEKGQDKIRKEVEEHKRKSDGVENKNDEPYWARNS